MRLRLRAGSAPIPFRTAFGHAAAVRTKAENVLVRIEDGKSVGLGEGCPRKYVTDEDVPCAMAFLDARGNELLGLENAEQLKTWIEGHEREIDANPSAFCAMELALLDLFARRAGQSVEALLGIEIPQEPIRASAIYGTGGAIKFYGQAFLFACNGVRDAKLKLSGDDAKDLARARALARLGPVRLDANNLWPNAEAAAPALRVLAAHAWAVEEPIGARDWDGLRAIAEQTGLGVIFDESFTVRADLDAAPKVVGMVPNLRISKLGGLLRSLDCLAQAGDRVIVGAQVGETSILARAGLALARAAGKRLAGYEGAYAPLLLSEDAAAPSFGFGYGGVVRSEAFNGTTGWGLAPRKALDLALMPALVET